MTDSIGFVGAGRWAIALALNFSRNGLNCSLWEPDSSSYERLSSTRKHPDLPADCRLDDSVRICSQPSDALTDADKVIFATPSNSLTSVAQVVKPVLNGKATIVSVTKGIDPSSLRRLSVTLTETFPRQPVVVLAGPGIPWDFALGDPTSLVAASEDIPAADRVRDCLTVGNLRIYSSGDVVGVEIGAAMKNVIAIAAGIADGLGLGINAKAALLTRGLAEITRLGISHNANPMTFAGLAGMGDLIVTACSEKSRNHELGRLIGSGLKMDEALARLNGVAEGALTVKSALQLAGRFRVELPITAEIADILFHDNEPRRSMNRLLQRKPKRENF